MSATDPIDDVNELLNGSVKRERLEYKACWDDQYTTGPEVLWTVRKFANDCNNTNGGYVTIGVDEQDGRAVRPPPGLSAEDVEAARCWIRDSCRRFVPPYQPEVSRKKVDDRFILVVWAPASDDGPHCGPFGGGSTEDDQQAAFDLVLDRSKEIRELVQEGKWERAEYELLEELEASQASTNTKSHVRNTLVHAAIEARKKTTAQRLLSDCRFAPSGQDAIDAAILAWRVRDELASRDFLKQAGSVALLEFAQAKIRLADEAHSRYEYERLLGHARSLLEQAIELDSSATQRGLAWRELAGVKSRLGCPAQEVEAAYRQAEELLPNELKLAPEPLPEPKFPPEPPVHGGLGR